jgi:hypothetical protein
MDATKMTNACNVVRHSGADAVTVEVAVNEDLCIDVIDDGRFFGAFNAITRRGFGSLLLTWCRNGLQPTRAPPTCHDASSSPTATPSLAA